MNDKRSPNRKVLPGVWNGAAALWNELLRGTPAGGGVAPTMEEPASWSSDLSAFEIKRLVAEYELARGR
jgi:hypothetical protein